MKSMTTALGIKIATPIALIFRVNEHAFNRALDGLTDEQLWLQPMPDTNPPLWIAGHIAACRKVVLKLTGVEFDTGWGGLFGRGAKLQQASEYPQIGEITRVMGEISSRLYQQLESLPNEKLAGPPMGLGFPKVTSLADEIAFLAMHDSLHIGQLAYLRKGMGLSPIFG